MTATGTGMTAAVTDGYDCFGIGVGLYTVDGKDQQYNYLRREKRRDGIRRKQENV